MKYKNLFIALAAFFSLASCSNIADDERLIFVEHKELETDPDESLYVATVLVEDFTGQKCTWCPFGTRVLEQQIALYGEERVIPVAIHSGPLGFRGTATQTGLMTELGVYYWNKNGFTNSTSQPTAVFNRRTTTDERDAWPASIYAELERKATCGIVASVAYNEATRQASITIECHAKEAKEAMLQLWLTESGITAMQIDNGETKRDYVHNHILRDAINGQDGDAVSLGMEPLTRTYTYTLPEQCNPANCHIVAFLYDETGVLQAQSISCTEQSASE